MLNCYAAYNGDDQHVSSSRAFDAVFFCYSCAVPLRYFVLGTLKISKM